MTTKVKALVRLAALAAAAASLAACATVTRGTNDHYHVESTPPDATVTTSHGFTCRTPCTMELPRKSEFDIKIVLDGYKDFEMRIVNEMSLAGGAGLAGNVIIGGVIGIGVDALTGATQDLKPNPLIVEMAPTGSADVSHIVSPPDATQTGEN